MRQPRERRVDNFHSCKRSEATYCPQNRLDENLEYRYGRQL
jgi:hypothetical protein